MKWLDKWHIIVSIHMAENKSKNIFVCCFAIFSGGNSFPRSSRVAGFSTSVS